MIPSRKHAQTSSPERPQHPTLLHLLFAAEARELELPWSKTIDNVQAQIEHIEGALQQRSLTGQGLADQAAQQIVASEGKRVRPLCLLLAYEIGQPNPSTSPRADACKLALAAELVHAATLLHDDVIDEGDWRRGRLSARARFGNSASILGGDLLLIEALRLVERHGTRDLLCGLFDTIAAMVHAEALQLEHQGSRVPSRQVYQEIAWGKTAALFGWSITAGAHLGGLSGKLCDTLEAVGHHLGLSFQLTDDLLDLIGDPAHMGKERSLDIADGKLTYPMILAVEQDPKLLDLLTEGGHNHDELELIRQRALNLGIAEQCRSELESHTKQALALLERAPLSPARHLMAELIIALEARTQ